MCSSDLDEAAVRKAMDDVRWHIAFYGSTRSYHGVWEMHGWLDTGLKLHELSVSNGWAQMSGLVTDEMVHKFAAVGTYDVIGERIIQRVTVVPISCAPAADLNA